jgi:hypothetical protein
VINGSIAATAFDKEEFGRWTWLVTPKKAGAHQLILKVSSPKPTTVARRFQESNVCFD